MASSLVKFSNRTKSAGRNLYWNRADIDGLPFRGPAPPIMPEEEYEHRAVRISDFRNGFFDVTNATENKLYCDVMECCFNGWFRLYYQEKFWTSPEGYRTTKHYLEWVEYYMEDGSRAPFVTSGMMEVGNGPQNFFGHPPQGP